MLKAMVEKVTFPLIVIDLEGQIVFANKGSEEFTGYTRDELVGVNLRDLCPPYERSRYLFSGFSNIQKTTEIDIDLRRKGDRLFMANISFSPFEHRGVSYLLLAMRDVTVKRVQEGKIREEEERYRKLLAERNRLEDQLNRSSKLACLGELAAGIAHEINNPLGIILGFVQDILDEILEEDSFFESVKIIEQETTRCVGVVKNLLDFARLKPPQITVVDIVQLLEDSIALLMPQIKKNKIVVNRLLEQGLPSIKVDPQLIQQVFLNVMINAIQAMPYGGELSVGVNLVNDSPQEKKPCRVRITLSDTGQGISPENFSRIFDPFFTTKGSKGTGLGLCVCQRILEDHCGKIEVESEEQAGTVCSIYLPIQLQSDIPA